MKEYIRIEFLSQVQKWHDRAKPAAYASQVCPTAMLPR
jgi:hypothetical protein